MRVQTASASRAGQELTFSWHCGRSQQSLAAQRVLVKLDSLFALVLSGPLPACHSVLLILTSLTVVAVDANPSDRAPPPSSRLSPRSSAPPLLSIPGPGFFHLGFFCYLCRKLNGMCIKIFATRQCGPCFNPNKRHQHLQFCVAYGIIAWELGLAKSSDLGTESSQQGEIGFKRCCNNQGIAVLLTIIEK